MKAVIEHLEGKLSKWVLLEYEHASSIVGRGNLTFTNVKGGADRKTLGKFGKQVTDKSVSELGVKDLLVLDPSAKKALSPADFPATIVIGGICGDSPRQGRTAELLTSKLGRCRARNIGKLQFTIDGATYVAKKISEGAHLGEIKVRPKLALELNEHETVEIPLAYPQGAVTPGLCEMLKKKRKF